MKRTYKRSQRLVAFILLISLLLQSCGNPTNLPLPSTKQTSDSQKALPQVDYQPILEKKLTANGEHLVTFYEEAGELKADVEMNVPKGFSKEYKSLEVAIEQGAELSSLLQLSEKAQQRRIHLQLAQGSQPAKVIIYKYKGAGLIGGMEVNEENLVSPVETRVNVNKTRKGFKLEKNFQETLLSQLPEGYSLGTAYDNGDCFFDSLAQWLNKLNDTDVNNIKYLRTLCHEFYSEKKELVDGWNQEDYRGIDKGENEYYMIQYTAEECERDFHGRAPIWGRPSIEGQMLCEKLHLKGILSIEVLKDPETGNPTISYHLVNQKKSRSITEEEGQTLVKAGNTPTIINVQNTQHFVPLIKIQKNRTYLQLAQGKQTDRIIVYKGAGLMGGSNKEKEKIIRENEEQAKNNKKGKKEVSNKEEEKLETYEEESKREIFDSCTRWTHSPNNGSTLYISEEAKLYLSSKPHGNSIGIINIPLKDSLFTLNHDLFFNTNYGGRINPRSNHLFISLNIIFKNSNLSVLSRQPYVLGCTGTNRFEFINYPFTPDLNFSYADFYNISRFQGETFKNSNYTVQFIRPDRNFEGITGVVRNNRTHSEPGALKFLYDHPELILNAITTLPDPSKIKVIQLGLHSFLDFCENCEPMVSEFQKTFGKSLEDYLKNNLPAAYSLGSVNKNKNNKLLFFVNGINNRFYRYKKYFFYKKESDNSDKLQPHEFKDYFLQQYRPFTGDFSWDSSIRGKNILLTFVNEPIGQAGFSPKGEIEMLPANIRFMFPLNRGAISWGSIRANALYHRTKKFLTYVTPNLSIIDLTGARIGIREDFDDGDCFGIDDGKKLNTILKGIQQCQNLSYLNLSENYISDYTGAKSLADLLKPFNNLTTLILSEAISYNSLKYVSKALQILPQLRYLDLSCNKIDADTFNDLTSGLFALTKLEYLDLYKNFLAIGKDWEEEEQEASTIGSLDWICHFVNATPTIRHVNLRNNKFGRIMPFSWQEVAENNDLKRDELKELLQRIDVKVEALEDNWLVESSEEERSSEEEVSD